MIKSLIKKIAIKEENHMEQKTQHLAQKKDFDQIQVPFSLQDDEQN